MSSASAERRTDTGQEVVTLGPPAAKGAVAGAEGWLEHLVGVRSSKPTYYAAWRRKSERLDRSIETLKEISAALCTTTEGPVALCEAVVAAAAHHFSPRWAAMAFTGDRLSDELPPLIVRYSDGLVDRSWEGAPARLRPMVARPARRGVVVDEPAAAAAGRGERGVGAHMLLGGEPLGMLAVGLSAGAEVDESDLSILGTLANQAAVALHIACLFQQGEDLRARAAAAARAAEQHAGELEQRGRQLERARRGLEDARRRQLLAHERGRIARELHDSVAQNIVSIGMSLEWCRQHLPASPVLDRVSIAKELARSALAQVRSAIFELSPEAPGDLVRAVREIVEELRLTTNLHIVLRTRGARRPLPLAVERALAQIAREALFNVARHAEAQHAWVTLSYGEHAVRLAVSDDGHGDPGVLQRRLERAGTSGSRYHLGLLNVAERAGGIDATARFAARRGGGVRLEVALSPPDPGT